MDLLFIRYDKNMNDVCELQNNVYFMFLNAFHMFRHLIKNGVLVVPYLGVYFSNWSMVDGDSKVNKIIAKHGTTITHISTIGLYKKIT